MDQLIEALQQLKNIEADKDYTKKSRFLLMSQISENRPRRAWALLLQGAQIGGAVAFASLLIALILGGLASSSLAPLRLSSLDQASLRAEAQAIDIQIRLTNLNYTQDLKAPILRESTPAGAIQLESGVQKKEEVPPNDLAGEKDASQELQPVDIDEALLQLSE
jgi:hypothetical protein